MSNVKKKTGLIALALGLCVTASVAFAAVTGQLTINGTATLTSPFKMVFATTEGTTVPTTGITAETTGDQTSAENLKLNTSDTSIAAFSVTLAEEGAGATYKFSVKNDGDSIAYLDNVHFAASSAVKDGTDSPVDMSLLPPFSYQLKIGSFTASSTGTEISPTPDSTISVEPGDKLAVELSVALTDDSKDSDSIAAIEDHIKLTLGAITINWTSVDPSAA